MTTYAIIEDSGSQLMVREGDIIEVDLRDLADNAKTVTFDRVLMLGGDKATLGMPYISGASVTADIVTREFKGEKIDIVKYKKRKNSKRKTGHRQRYMRVKVASIKA
ncbi:MAG: 50S ribosomal protein L21 [Phycisphaeraceae bacterium]|nr:50S ribosomal protein L21 [Phycisphaeraceae bacterium]